MAVELTGTFLCVGTALKSCFLPCLLINIVVDRKCGLMNELHWWVLYCGLCGNVHNNAGVFGGQPPNTPFLCCNDLGSMVLVWPWEGQTNLHATVMTVRSFLGKGNST